ncbi:MAG TPA: hypothetical protein VF798_15280 [Burkholderiaceae bacterium]
MATVSATYDNDGAPDDAVRLVSWAGLANAGDVGDTQSLPAYSEKTFTVTGTFGGGASCTIQGSNDGTNWVALTNKQGNALTFTAAGIGTSQDRPLYIRPNLAAGAGASVTVICAAHKFSLSGKPR